MEPTQNILSLTDIYRKMELREQIKQIKRLLGEQGTPAENNIIDELRDILKVWETKDYPSAEVRYRTYYRDIENLINSTLKKQP